MPAEARLTRGGLLTGAGVCPKAGTGSWPSGVPPASEDLELGLWCVCVFASTALDLHFHHSAGRASSQVKAIPAPTT